MDVSAPEPPAGDLLEIGHIRRPHGLHGDVYVQLTSDRHERLDAGSSLVAGSNRLTVRSSRVAANGRWIVSFEGIDDRSSAERFTNVVLRAAPLDDADALWVHELVGKAVVDQFGERRGTCVALVANPAADLLELDSGALVPSNFVVSTDGGVIEVDTPDGLFDLP